MQTHSPRRAVLDVGSNSVLLLVSEQDGARWNVVREATRVTALGEGTKATGLLGESGMTHTLAAIAEFWEAARELGATNIRAFATMAARIATNTPVFLGRAAAQGTPVEVMSGDDEAHYGFSAVANDATFAASTRIAIVDVGGQSTELLLAERESDTWNVRHQRSYPIGTLGLRSGVLRDESPDFAARLNAVVQIDEAIDLSETLPPPVETVALGATGTNLVTIADRATAWEPKRVHGRYLDYTDIGRMAGWLLDMTDAERAALVGIEPGRERSIHIGALILERFLFALKVPGCRVSVRGWRHAVLENS
ncbi:MAG: hypothetical protein KIS66_05515 [Fimbriimonadaceae bacterium]|nr:hypothetical protein [Fimbriimonadaceae bacterium]